MLLLEELLDELELEELLLDEEELLLLDMDELLDEHPYTPQPPTPPPVDPLL